MPTEVRDGLKRPIQEGDESRCRECGSAVAADRGGCPEIEPMGPPAQAGTDVRENLRPLCFPCYATRGLRAHAELLPATMPDRLPEFVKQMTRDFGLNLLAYSEWIDPRRFDPAEALEEFDLWRRYLDTIAELARAAQAADPIADC